MRHTTYEPSFSLNKHPGTVVNQSSMSAVQGFNRPYMGVYSSSKAAVYSLSDCMRVELAPFDVKVSLSPTRAQNVADAAHQVVTLVSGSVKTEFFNPTKDGRAIPTLPSTSVYSPIRESVEPMLAISLSGGKNHDRMYVTRKTVAALCRRYWPTSRYIRRGYLAIKVWLMHLLLPTWLIDRWARQSGGLDKLRRILNA